MPTIVINNGQMVNGWIRPDETWYEQNSVINEEVVNLTFYIIDENNDIAYIDPSSAIIQDENDETDIILPQRNGYSYNIGTNPIADWGGEVSLKNGEITVTSNDDGGSTPQTKLFGIRVISITYQGTTYTKFNYT